MIREVLVALLLPGVLGAQNAQGAQGTPSTQSTPSTQREVPALVRTGKWIGAGIFAGSMAMAFIEHHSANRAFDRLRDYCRVGSCAIGPDGRYVDAGAEARYKEVVGGDRTARVWLIVGQATFVATAALFVVELTTDRGTTNIPFSGLVVEPGRVGWRLTF